MLAPVTREVCMYFHRQMFVVVSRLRVAPEKQAEFFRFRVAEVLPEQGRQPGFIFSQLLRRTGATDEFLLINAWARKEDVDQWHATEVDAQIRARAVGILAGPLERIGEYEEVHL
jgi:heme-degrading monooxygenase HmoA